MSAEVKAAIAILLLVFLSVVGIREVTLYGDKKDAEWQKFVMDHHCKATQQSGMDMAERVWTCDGFDVEHE